MTDLDALHAAILEQPDEDTPRLAYADLLDERGGVGDRERAAFIRAQIATARHGYENMVCERRQVKLSHTRDVGPLFVLRCRCRPCSLSRREYEASKRHVLLWEREAMRPWWEAFRSAVAAVAIDPLNRYDPLGEMPPFPWFRRGFVSRVRLSSEQLRHHGAAIFAANPIEVLTLADWPTPHVEIDTPGGDHGWQAYYFAHDTHSPSLYNSMNGWDRREDVIPGIIRDLGIP